MDYQRRQLLLSIHDVGPRFASEVDRHADRMAAAGVDNRYAMLVVPNHWGKAPLAGSDFGTRLRDWAAAGVEMFVHGWFHRDEAQHGSSADRFRAKHMTAGEGEFLGLDRAEASRRMADGRKLIEDIIGRPVAGFIAPAWLYGDGAREALKDNGFAIAEDHMRVWSPSSSDRVLARGPVITWASRSKSRIASSLLAAKALRWVLKASPIVRVAVHPGDVHVDALNRSIDRTIQSFTNSHRPGRYSDLLERAA
ncbi:MAG TPA: polysaccharide deacetylase family protein [Sphingobium sp.]|uniref:polysaccharide deacetylase family protein n=1 Tax=Sphingobium sp. TaxID=1912891 RepID=UPI002ED3DEDD